MISALQTIVGEFLRRLSQEARTDVPNGLTALVIALGGYLAARVARWLVARALRGFDLDGRMRESGLAAVIDSRGALSVSRIATQGVYWAVLAITAVAALHVVGAQVTSRIVSSVLGLAPRLAGGAAIVIGGMWLGLYLSRGTLIWAVNEGLPAPRKLAVAVRVLIVFAAVAVAADMVNLGGGLFRAVFIVVLGGVVLSASLAIGLGSRDVVRRYFEERMEQARAQDGGRREEEKVWNHL